MTVKDSEKSAVRYDRYALVQLLRAIEAFRAIDPDMPLQTAASFLYCGIYPGCTMRDIQKNLSISQSSCSRNVAALSDRHRLGKPGPGLLEAVEDPVERRRKIVRLSERGEEMAVGLSEALMDPIKLYSFQKGI